MESQIRGNVLSHVPNGKQFCFPFVSGHWTSHSLGKQVLVAEPSVVPGGLCRDRYWDPPCWCSGLTLYTRREPGVCLKGTGAPDSQVTGPGCTHLAGSHFLSPAAGYSQPQLLSFPTYENRFGSVAGQGGCREAGRQQVAAFYLWGRVQGCPPQACPSAGLPLAQDPPLLRSLPWQSCSFLVSQPVVQQSDE